MMIDRGSFVWWLLTSVVVEGVLRPQEVRWVIAQRTISSPTIPRAEIVGGGLCGSDCGRKDGTISTTMRKEWTLARRRER